jgi:hypothetical protein
MIPNKTNALKSLRPNAQWSWDGLEVAGITMVSSDTVPTQEELDAELIKLQTAYDSVAYQRSRVAEYPDWGTQLDYIYHNGIEKWKTDIVDPVKKKYPKPE